MISEVELMRLLENWYEVSISMCNRVTSGNVSHQVPALKGYLQRVSVFLSKHYPENELAIKHSNIFESLSEKCDRITSGNVSHEISLIRGVSNNYVYLFRDLIKMREK